MCFINIIMVFGIMTSRDFKLDVGVCLHNERELFYIKINNTQ